jgi:hypothetical protein
MTKLRWNSIRQWREEVVPASGVQIDSQPCDNAPFEVSLNLPLDLPGIFEYQLSAGHGIHDTRHAKATCTRRATSSRTSSPA